VRRLGISGANEWRAYCRGDLPRLPRRPPEMPAHPHTAYANVGWTSWARSLELPTNPNKVYRDQGWRGWSDFLGTCRTTRAFSWPLAKARAFVRRLGITTVAEWDAYCRGDRADLPPRPREMPAHPADFYADEGWTGWGDFFGTGAVWTHRQTHWPFSRARDYARSLRLAGVMQWRAYCRGELRGLRHALVVSQGTGVRRPPRFVERRGVACLLPRRPCRSAAPSGGGPAAPAGHVPRARLARLVPLAGQAETVLTSRRAVWRKHERHERRPCDRSR
jgi:hypothetical protein